MDVGDELIRKRETPRGEWIPNVKRALHLPNGESARVRSAQLMRLARHRGLIRKKAETPHGEYSSRVTNIGLNASNCCRLIRMARHRGLCTGVHRSI